MRLFRLVVPALLLATAACTSIEYQDGVPVSKENSIVQTEIQRRIDEIQFLHGRELLDNLTALSRMGDAATTRIRKGLQSPDWLTRSSLAWVIGAMGDRRNIPALRELLTDENAEVRYQTADSLVELGDATGFPVLVNGLADGDIRNRYKCFEALKRSTGQEFGYAHDGDAETRRVAVARWLDWLDGIRASAL